MATDAQYAQRFNAFKGAKQYSQFNPQQYGREQTYLQMDPNLNVPATEVDQLAASNSGGMFGDMEQKIAQAYKREADVQLSNPENKPYWYRQVDMMMRSGNPYLMDQAQAILGKIQSSAFENKRSSSAQIALDLGLREGTPEFEKFVREHAMKAGTTIDMSSPDSRYGKVPNGFRWKDPNNMELGVEPIPGSNESKLSSAEAADAAKYQSLVTRLDEVQEAVLSGDVDLSGFGGLFEAWRSEANLQGATLNAIMNKAGIKMDPKAAKAMAQVSSVHNTMLNLLSGAAVSEHEAARINRELPVPGQPREVFLMNMYLTKINMQDLQERIARERGINYQGAANAVPTREIPPLPTGMEFIQ